MVLRKKPAKVFVRRCDRLVTLDQKIQELGLPGHSREELSLFLRQHNMPLEWDRGVKKYWDTKKFKAALQTFYALKESDKLLDSKEYARLMTTYGFDLSSFLI